MPERVTHPAAGCGRGTLDQRNGAPAGNGFLGAGAIGFGRAAAEQPGTDALDTGALDIGAPVAVARWRDVDRAAAAGG
ncbi:hypothetical protein, partial [Jatrophihabitans lederbergiae]